LLRKTTKSRHEDTMRKIYDQLDDRLVDFIGRQHVFFVGTAPDSPDGHLNVSPKGLDTFHILGPRTVAYLDLTGSGIETVAHIRQNGRHEKNRASIDGLAGLRWVGGDGR
jgi:hypothetical protein